MGVNAQIEVPAFTAGQVLTAAEMTQINTGIPVFATTVTRDAAFGGAGEKVLAQGQYAYIEATSSLMVYSGSAWINAIASGLNLISSTTIGSAVASVTISSAFSATYDAYKIVVTGGVGSLGNEDLRLQLGATTTGYYFGGNGVTYSTNAATTSATNNGAYFAVGYTQTTGLNASFELQNPFLASITYVNSTSINTNNARSLGGYLSNTTSYTAFTLTVSTGTLTGGTIRVYGYANS